MIHDMYILYIYICVQSTLHVYLQTVDISMDFEASVTHVSTCSLHKRPPSCQSSSPTKWRKHPPWRIRIRQMHWLKSRGRPFAVSFPLRIHGTNGIFTYIYHKFKPNVGKYTSRMDTMGLIKLEWLVEPSKSEKYSSNFYSPRIGEKKIKHI